MVRFCSPSKLADVTPSHLTALSAMITRNCCDETNNTNTSGRFFGKSDTRCTMCRFSDCVNLLKPGAGALRPGGWEISLISSSPCRVLPQNAGMLLKAHERDGRDRPLRDPGLYDSQGSDEPASASLRKLYGSIKAATATLQTKNVLIQIQY